MVAVVLCVAFSGFIGGGLSLAMVGGGGTSGAGLGALAFGAAGLAGVVLLPLRRM